MSLNSINNLFLILALVCTVPVWCANSPCKQQGLCYCVLQNGSYINLADISSHGKPRFTELIYVPKPEINTTVGPDEIALFSYDPCSPFTETNSDAITISTESPCVDALACKLTPGKSDGTGAELHAIAMPDRVQFLEENGNFHILYKTPGASNLTVNLVCNSSVDQELVIDSIGRYNHTMTLTTKCACSGGCSAPKPHEDPEKQGLSTGSILLIIFFTLLVIYLIGGVTYNFFHGATGSEMLPHSQFWNDLPQLIMDGFIFTCSCIGRRSPNSYSDL